MLKKIAVSSKRLYSCMPGIENGIPRAGEPQACGPGKLWIVRTIHFSVMCFDITSTVTTGIGVFCTSSLQGGGIGEPMCNLQRDPLRLLHIHHSRKMITKIKKKNVICIR